MREYKTIRQAAEATHIVERSKFIAHIRRVESREEAEQFIAAVKKEYWDARHNVYAYVLKNGESRCSDDGEPSGTSGMPSLEVLLKQGFCDVCVVITRYFGGILLGTGGLVRAYSKAVALALEAAGIAAVAECAVFELHAAYAHCDKVQRLLSENDCVTDNTAYAEDVTFTFHTRVGNSNTICDKIIENFSGELKPKLIKTEFKEL